MAGFMGAGCVLLAKVALKKVVTIPRSAVPIGAGLFMIAATVSSEYGWFPNAARSLPQGFEVVATVDFQEWWKPWTQVRPYVNSFLAMDVATMRQNETNPDLRIVDLYVHTRWQPIRSLQLAVDCGEGTRADPAEGISMDETGRPTGVTWRTVPADDPLLSAACG